MRNAHPTPFLFDNWLGRCRVDVELESDSELTIKCGEVQFDTFMLCNLDVVVAFDCCYLQIHRLTTKNIFS